MQERIASLVVVFVCAAIAFNSGGVKASIDSILAQLAGLLLIWCADFLGQFTTPGLDGIDKASGGCAVRMLGWMFLFAPYILRMMFAQ